MVAGFVSILCRHEARYSFKAVEKTVLALRLSGPRCLSAPRAILLSGCGEVTIMVADPGDPAAQARLACTPAAIRAVLAANADPETLHHYDDDLDAAFERSRRLGDLTPLVDTVRRWWFEADSWRDPAARSEYQARISRYLADGPPPRARRVSRAQITERYGV